MSDTSTDLEGRVAIITGAGQGIGRVYAHHFAAAGARVVIAELDAENARAVAREIADQHGDVIAIETDVADEQSVAAMVTRTVDKFGAVDVLVNNAAIFTTLSRQPFEDIPLADWEHVMRVNVTGSFLCARAVAPVMRKAGWGRIINISSSTVPLGLPMFLHYVTSKAAVIGMTRSMARELGKDGITVNAILPGLTTTEVEALGRTREGIAAVVARQCIPRPEVPEDLVGMVLFLASPAAAFVTGQSITVDGGAAHS